MPLLNAAFLVEHAGIVLAARATMRVGAWERLQRMLKLAVSRRFGTDVSTSATAGRPQDDSPSSGSKSVDTPQAAATVTLVRPPVQVSQTPGSLTCGQIVAGRFRILRFISSGGMGEVFEAWDSELGELVALKTIRSEIASFPWVIDRFKQEVRQARAISHINVCRVYEVFSHPQDSGEPIWFLTMELLGGQTLAQRLRERGPFAPEQALDIVEQMVAGLAAAHEHGVVHRDFKSSNVILVDSPAGKTRAVVTDFGLAVKVLTAHHTGSETSKQGTPRTSPEGSKQGTPRYMAPEQMQGGEVGFAADQYALGVVICEMLTGQCPLYQESVFGIAKALLPPGYDLNSRWKTVIRRCLEFRPEDRFAEIRDVGVALNPARQSRAVWIMGVAIAFALILTLAALKTRELGDRVEAASQLTPDTDLTSRPSLSRDGTTIAYSSDREKSGNLSIWLQHLPSGTTKRLTTSDVEDVDPNLAQDGSAVVFRSERDGGGVYIVAAAGGKERLLARYGRNPRFSPDGHSIVYWIGDRDSTIASGQIFILSLVDGSSARVASDFKDARSPVWSSDGLHILFTGCRTADQPMPACSEWWVMSRDGKDVKDTGSLALLRGAQVQVVDLIGGWYENTVLFSGRRESTTSLWELTLPQSTLRAEGKPRQLTSGEAREVAPSLAQNGNIAFEHLTAALHIWRIDHASDPKKAAVTKVTQDPTIDVSPSISSNGEWLTFARGYPSKRDIWIKDMRSGTESVFFSAPGDKLSPIVDNSGRVVVLEALKEDVPALLAATRDQPARTLPTRCSDPTGWFDDNRAVFCRNGLPSRIEMVDLVTGVMTTVLKKDNQSLSEASWSEQNQYLLFTALRDGTTKQVFAVFYPKSTHTATGEWIPITSKSEFSERPRWSGDGGTVFYLSRRDGFSCVWAQRFDPKAGQVLGDPFPVLHYHNPRFSPEVVVNRSFNLSVAGDSVYLNVGEINTSIWVGRLKRHGIFSFLRRSP